MTNSSDESRNRDKALEVRTRYDLLAYIQHALTPEYLDVFDEEVRQRSTFAKAYVLENHTVGNLALREQLLRVFTRVDILPDSSLLRCIIDREVYFVDALNSRFLVLHSIEVAERTDHTFRRLAENDDAAFDHAWLPRSLLLAAMRGQMVGFTYKFSLSTPDVSFRVPEVVDVESGEIISEHVGAPQGRFRLDVEEDSRADKEFASLEKAHIFTGRKTLDQVQFQVNTDQDSITNRVYSFGKVTGKGGDAGSHINTIDHVVTEYGSTIQKFEADFAVGWRRSGGSVSFGGGPLTFVFPSSVEISNLHSFAASMFDGRSRFRLFGIPHRETERRIDVRAIDLHTGDPVSFEITDNWIRIYLPVGSCGNVITRFITNLQHHLNAESSLLDGDGNAVLT